MPAALIQVDNYHKSYNEFDAVSGLSFQVNAGEILGLVGPNGAGKTTTLRALVGIIPPTSGALFAAGFDIVKQSVEAKRELAFIPDDPRLFDSLTVWEHLEFIAAAYRLQNFETYGEALLRRFDLLEKRDVFANELSRGMRQKVAIICAYLRDPKVIILDEPLTGLDPRGIRQMKDSILERARDGAAVVISSHLLDLVEDMCSHLLILNRGRSLFFGSVAEARGAFSDMQENSTLEDIFFRITESGGDTQAEVMGEETPQS
ncbi:MAG: ATP-binding cassette domain-containing protein [bacterium]|nr:ATP-binding cassette domain-containing protein [bacterium]